MFKKCVFNVPAEAYNHEYMEVRNDWTGCRFFVRSYDSYEEATKRRLLGDREILRTNEVER